MKKNIFKNILSIVVSFGTIFLLCTPLITRVVSAAAGVPKIINFQGRLLDATTGDLLGGPSGTDYCYKFSLYSASTGGSKVWPAGAPSTMTILTREGVFNASIGDTGAGGDTLDFDFQTTDTVFVDVEVAEKVGASCTTGGDEVFEALTPRQQVVSSGYAINSGTVGGFTPAQSATGNQVTALTSGSLILGDTNPGIKVTGSNTLTFQSGLTGDIQFFSGSNKITSTGALTIAGSLTAAGVSLGTGSITMTGSLGSTGARLTKGWFTDLEVTNTIVGSITGNAATVTTNANLTGAITSVGNATSLGSFSTSALNTALNDNDVATLAGTEALTNKTLTAPKFADLGFIADANGNELLIFDSVASAVNELTLKNAAVGTGVSLAATGGDAAIDLTLGAKGTGIIKLDTTGTSTTVYVGNQTNNSTGSILSQRGKSAGGTALSATWTLDTSGYYALDSQTVSDIISITTTSGDVGIGVAIPMSSSILTVGNAGVNNSSDAAILISRTVDDGTAGNGHAFSDSSQVSRSGGIGYNSFDGRINFTGTADYDHYAAFQSAPNYASSGIMDNYYGLHSSLVVGAGTITSAFGTYVANPTGAGTVTNNYGLYVASLTKGTTNNYAIYTSGTTDSYFGGDVGVGVLPGSAPLHAKSSVAVNASGQEVLRLDASYSSGTVGSGAMLSFNSGATQFGSIRSFTEASSKIGMSFSTFNSTMGERLRISAAGNVGIGETIPTAVLHLKAGTTAASSAPLKFTSGALNTTAEAGAVEFLTDAYYGTITTGAARKTFAFLESPTFTTPNIGVATGSSGTVIGSQTFTTNNIADSGALTIATAAASALTLNSGTTGTINIGTDASAETINIGNTGAAVKTILIGNAAQANTITIGSASATNVSITDDNWSITAAGVLTVASCSGCGGGGGTLDQAYTSGNTIGTDTASDIIFNLAEVATPTQFIVNNLDTAGVNAIQIDNGIASGTLTNGLFIEQSGAGTMTSAIQITETAGTITDGIAIIGTLGNILNTPTIDITGAGAITGATLTSPKFADLDFIADANGNELLIFDSVGSAVNELTLKNAISGTGVSLAATGGDAAIDLTLGAKGTGIIKLDTTGTSTTVYVGNQTNNSTGSILSQRGKSGGGTALSATWTLTAAGFYALTTQSVSNYLVFNTTTATAGFGDGSPDYTLEVSNATPIFAVSDSDVAHGVTTLADTDVMFRVSSISALVGGAQLTGFADADGIAFQVKGIQSSNPTDTTPAILLTGAKANGTGVQDLAAAETVLEVVNNATSLFTVLGNGNVAIVAGNLAFGATTRITSTGVGTFITGTVIGSQTFTTNNIADSGALTIATGTASDLTLNSGTTGTINIGTDASAETINIGNTGAAVKTILIGNAAQANTITIGSASATNVSITDDNWSITAAGVLTVASCSGCGGGSFDSTAVDATTWSDGANASNIWTFDVSGTDHTMTASSGLMTFGDSVTITDTLTVNGAVAFTPTAGADFILSAGAGTNFQITATAAPTVDMMALTNAGQGTTSSGVDGLAIAFVTGDGASLTNSAIDVTLTNGGTAAGDVIRGLTLNNITPTAATETGLYIGTGFDSDIEFADASVTFQLSDRGVLSIVDGSSGVGTLLAVGSTLSRGDLDVYGNLIKKGYVDQTAITGINDVFVYDTARDTDGGAWTTSMKSLGNSWYTETKDDGVGDACNISSDDRCGTSSFPKKAILVATDSALYVFDGNSNTMWMKFTQAATGALGADTNNNPSSVYAQNGTIYVGTNGSSGTGMYEFDFTGDKMFRYNTTNMSQADVAIGSRNSTVTYNVNSNTVMALRGTNANLVNDVHATTIQGGAGVQTNGGPLNGGRFIVAATDDGIQAVNTNTKITYVFGNGAITDNYQSVYVTRRGRVYGLNSTDSSADRFGLSANSANSIDITQADITSVAKSFNGTTRPASLWKSAPTINTGAPDALDVCEQCSYAEVDTVATGRGDVLYVGHSLGLTEIHDTSLVSSATVQPWSKFYTKALQTDYMPATNKGMYSFEETTGDLTDSAVTNNVLEPENAPTYGVNGVRGKGLRFDGANDFLCSDVDNNGACDVETDFNSTTTAFFVSFWFKTNGTVSALQTLVDKSTTTAAGAAATGWRVWLTTTGAVSFAIDDDTAFTPDDVATSTDDFDDSQWHHVFAQRTNAAGRLDLFVDGRLVGNDATISATLTLETTSAVLSVGARCNVIAACTTAQEFFNGDMDDLVFAMGGATTTDTLNQAQVRKMYIAGLEAMKHKTITVSAATAATSTTITDTGESWIPNEFVGQIVEITGGTGVGQTRRVISNTVDTLTVSPAWSTTPTGADFAIEPEFLYGSSNNVTSVGATTEPFMGVTQSLYVGTDEGSDGGGVTVFGGFGNSFISDVYHGDTEKLDNGGLEWTGTDYDDIQSIDIKSGVLIIGSGAGTWVEMPDRDIQQSLDFLAGNINLIRAELIADSMQASGLEFGAVGSADLAEYYYSNSVLEPGDVVAIQPDQPAGIDKSTKRYQKNLLGVVSTAPALTIGAVAENSYAIALAGRIPVKITNENGEVHAGDMLTSASRPGYAMKATTAGSVLGRVINEPDAMNSCDVALPAIEESVGDGPGVDALNTVTPQTSTSTEQDSSQDTSGDEELCGYAMLFVGLSDFLGANIDVLSQEYALLNPETIEVEGLEVPLEGEDENILQKKIMAFLDFTQTKRKENTELQSVFTDKLAAAFEIISPAMYTKGLRVNSIDVFDEELVSMMSDVEFFGTPYLNKDTGGFAVVRSGDRSVDVVFDKDYLEQPIVNVTITLEDAEDAEAIFRDDIRYVVTKKTTHGFRILINKDAPSDTKFSWTAFAVKSPNVFFSLLSEEAVDEGEVYEEPVSDPEPEPVVNPAGEGQTELESSGSGGEVEMTSDGALVESDPVLELELAVDPAPEPEPEPEPTPEPLAELTPPVELSF